MRIPLRWLTTLFVGLLVSRAGICDDRDLFAAIANAGAQGVGSVAARQACEELMLRDVQVLPELLVAMDTPNPVAANWFRTVFEHIVEREERQSNDDWPVRALERFVSDSHRSGRPRRLALRLLRRREPQFEARWLPGRLNDDEFRHDAVALLLEKGDQALQDTDTTLARTLFQQAFQSARDRSQVTAAAGQLQSLGESADVIRQLGLVTDWWLVGPFAAPHKSGFSTRFEPEAQFDVRAEYLRENDSAVGWVRHQTDDPLGLLNLVTVLGKTDEAVAYAWTEIRLNEDRMAQLRCGADDCCLVWLNGTPVSSHEQWLNGTRFDRFVSSVTLKRGRNTILVKICQGPQHRNPEVFNNWSLQLRLCDEDGRGIAFEKALD